MAKAKRKPSKTEADLVALFESSDKRIEALLTKVLNKVGDETPTMAYLRKYQAQIRAILKRLKKDSAGWVDDVVPQVYNEGVASADNELEEAGIKLEVDFGRLHKQSIKVLSEAVGTRFSDAIDVIGRRADDVFRTVQLDAVAGSVMGYESIQQTTRRLKDELIAKGLTTFKDASGRNWSLRNYADMAARTVTMEAQNRGRWNEFAAHDEDLIIVSSHPMTCPKCEPWQGKVLSISGKTPGYPTVAEAKEAGLWHPRCRHSSALWVEEEDAALEQGPPTLTGIAAVEAKIAVLVPGAGLDIGTLSPFAGERVARAIEAVKKEFPSIVKRLNYVGAYEDAAKIPAGVAGKPAKTAAGDKYWLVDLLGGYLGDGAETYDNGASTALGLNIRLWELGKDDFERSIKGYSGGHLAKNTVDGEYLITHELGHVAHSWLMDKIGPKWMKWYNYHKSEIDSLSNYAKTNYHEGMAECFAEAIAVGKSPVGKALLRLLKKLGG